MRNVGARLRSARHTTSDRMAAHRTLDRRRSWRGWERELWRQALEERGLRVFPNDWSKFCIRTQRVFTLIFGSVAFENSALLWASEHRRHHKHVDHDDDDPYSISKAFFYAHICRLRTRFLYLHLPLFGYLGYCDPPHKSKMAPKCL